MTEMLQVCPAALHNDHHESTPVVPVTKLRKTGYSLNPSMIFLARSLLDMVDGWLVFNLRQPNANEWQDTGSKVSVCPLCDPIQQSYWMDEVWCPCDSACVVA